MRRFWKRRRATLERPHRRRENTASNADRAGWFGGTGRATLGNRRGRTCRIEPLEHRVLLAVSPVDATPVASDFGAVVQAIELGSSGDLSPVVVGEELFTGNDQSRSAAFHFAFFGTPVLEEIGGGVVVDLEGESEWIATGEPVVPVRESAILLPQGMEVTSIDVTYSDEGVVIGHGVDLLAAPLAVPLDGSVDVDSIDAWTLWDSSRGSREPVEFTNHRVSGYQVGLLRLFPVVHDAVADTLTYHSEMSVVVTAGATESGGAVDGRHSESDRARIVKMVQNPEVVDTYTFEASPTSGGTSPLDPGLQYEYVIVTSSALEGAFRPLVSQKTRRGLSAGIVTTETINANYSGTETGDTADKIREFLADAYQTWGTEWVLLGGDSEVVPQRGVYASVDATIDYRLPTDLYYACLDGTWNGDGDTVWGESNDGPGGGDIDLMAEIHVGRAPVSTISEATHFVAKTVQYETVAHPEATTAVWLGENLDANTWGSYSGIPIREQVLPDDWNVIERYDTSGGWTGSDLMADLNASPHLVNHLGHASETYNARLTNMNVAELANASPYFIYSQGCNSGSFDTRDITIAEQHLVAEGGAFGAVMNSRFGWYIPGNTPGGSHHYAAEFWDAAFNEGITHLGQVNQDSKDDNLFRVGSTGLYRWIHFETNLFGDPETPFQIHDGPGGTSGEIRGTVWHDADADGTQRPPEPGLAGQTVFLDANQNGLFDSDHATTVASKGVITLVDAGTATTTLEVQNAALISDINVTLDITHTYASDLEVYLTGPSGTRVELFGNVGGWGENFSGTTLDDEAPTGIQNANAPFSGAFRPAEAFDLFDGQLAQGTWTLEIVDTAAWDTGTLNHWSLEITSAETSTRTDAHGAYAFTGLADGYYSVRHELPFGWSHTDSSGGVREVTLQNARLIDGADFHASENSQPAIDLGPIDFVEISDLNLHAETTRYVGRTTRDGFLSVDASFQGAADAVQIELYDEYRNLLSTSAASGSGQRIDWNALADQTYFFHVSGNASNLTLRAANLVQHDGQEVIVHGTSGNDRVDFFAGSRQATINGLGYQFQASQASSFSFAGGGGTDVAHFYDSSADDRFEATPTHAQLSGPGYISQATSFRYVNAYSLLGGSDEAYLHDSAGSDRFEATPEQGSLSGDGFHHRVVSFDTVTVSANSGGNDQANLYDSPGNDTFLATPDVATLSGDGFCYRVESFGSVHAYSQYGGGDTARLYDSPGNDTFLATPEFGRISGPGFLNWAKSFDQVHAYSQNGGSDTATFRDSPGNDTFVATPGYGELYGSDFFNRAMHFGRVTAYSTAGGTDLAHLYDSAGNDTFAATSQYAVLRGRGFVNRAFFFEQTQAHANAGGHDLAKLFDSAGDDIFTSTPREATLSGMGYSNRAENFREVHAYATRGGHDLATLHDSNGLDSLDSRGQWARLHNQTDPFNFSNRAYGFESVTALSSNSQDQANIDPTTLDWLITKNWDYDLF